MRLCSCGFANPDDATRCAACGSTLTGSTYAAVRDPSTTGLRPFAQDDTTAAGPCPSVQKDAETAGGVLVLEEVRSGQVVRVPAPGGILGRAGDFSPDLFSPRVSGVHAVVTIDEKGRWTIEHTGRNASSVARAGVWSDLRCGAPQPLFGGETLKLADMVFRVRVGADERATEPNAQVNPVGGGWSVRCPVCGTEYAVEGPEGRIAACTFCKDPLDARQIARVAARAIPAR